MSVRSAVKADVPEILQIYNAGIDERIATFETSHRKISDIEKWFERSHEIAVAEREGRIAGFAVSFPYSSRECYSGVAEFSVYVRKEDRGNGFGTMVMKELIRLCSDRGIWKLVSRIFPENIASRSLMKHLGFREVGIYEKHSSLEGKWRDVVIVELLIRKNMQS